MLRKWEEDLCGPVAKITAVFTEEEAVKKGVGIVLYGWSSYFPHEANRVGGLSSHESFWFPSVQCDEINELMEQVILEVLPAVRAELCRQIEEALCGYEGKFPLRPVCWHGYYFGEHSWLERTDSYTGHIAHSNWSIDMETKLAVQGQ